MSSCSYPQSFQFARTISTVFALILAPGISAFACPSTVPAGVTNCYYFDYASGSDSANGTSESTPWQHAPGMANATGNAAGHTPDPGEGWIFKGGVTVDYHAFPMNTPWGGTNGSPDYMGYDSAWYTGSAWARPIFNGGGSTGYNTANQSLITDIAHHSSYVVIDNLEFTGIYFASACSESGPQNCGAVSQYGYSGSDVSWEIKNVYVHGWSHCPVSNCPTVIDPGNQSAFLWTNQDTTGASSVHDSVVDGTDSSQDCCNAISSWVEYNNYIAYVDNAAFGERSLFHDNVITHMVVTFGGVVHGNCIHLFGGQSLNELIYNNYVSCLNTGTSDEMFLIEETGGAVVYAFNNVMVMDGHGSGFEIKNPNTNFLFQNTQECGPDPSTGATCIQMSGGSTTTASNNFAVTTNANSNTVTNSSGNLSAAPVAPKTCSAGAQNLYGGTQICAPVGSGNGTGNLNISQTYPFAPLDSTAAATVGTAPGNSALCATVAGINGAAGAACLSDTTLGIAYDATNHTVSFPARTPVQRPTSGPWQIGAYESGQTPPSPPTGLSAVVN
jgi:hypothetical protein